MKMNLKMLVGLCMFILLQLSCSQKESKTTAQTIDSTQHNFFPVTKYILGQLKEIESQPVTPLKIISDNGRTDSAWIKREDIRAFAQPFLQPEIDTGSFKNFFTESSFLDQTINAVTLSYNPINILPDSLQIRQWVVYIDPKSQLVNRVYIVKRIKEDDNLKTLQLTWKSGQWCKITSIVESPKARSAIKEETIKWNFN